MKFKALAEKIIELKNRDLELRSHLIQSGQIGDDYHQSMAELHNQNAEALDEIMQEIGYPRIDKVGNDGSETAWLIIQHAIGMPSFMKTCAKLLEKAVRQKKANPINLAYLTDRIAVFSGGLQVYGTQFDWDENGEMSPNAYGDLYEVNQRRKLIGLNSLEEQIEKMREQVINENQNSPSNFVERKLQFEKWKKAVGWTE